MGESNESVDLPGELVDTADYAVAPKKVSHAVMIKEEEHAELLAFREKMQWLGRQVGAINEKGEEGRKAAETSAKQVAPMFDGPFEKEIIQFFIRDGGKGDGDGDGKDGKSGAGSGSATAEGNSEGKGESKAEGKGSSGTSGNDRSESGTSEGVVLPDGVHTIADVASFSALALPKDSPHRMHYVRKAMLEDDGEAFDYIGSAYGVPFLCHKYGGSFTFDGTK